MTAVTVIEDGPGPVVQVKTTDVDGYDAVQLAFDAVAERSSRSPSSAICARPASPSRHSSSSAARANQGRARPYLEAFEPGDEIKVSGISVGKGFQGTIKRHNFSRGPVSHGSHNVRKPGSIGASAYPSRVFKGKKMPGRMGGVRVTQPGLVVHEVDVERNLLLVRGSVPGAKSGLLEIVSR